MIIVELKDNYIEVKGHANQNEYGSDIVCASVSTAVIMTINLIDKFNLINKIDYKLNDGYTIIKVLEKNQTINVIIDNLIYTLKNLENSYKKYIKIK